MTLLSIDTPSSVLSPEDVAARTPDIHGLNVVLIKPSRYDDDGYILRHWRGVLPSNTLGCLYGLTEDVRKREALRPGLEITTELMDEGVMKINVPKIIQRSRRKGWKTVVCLVGVQSNR